VRKKSQTRMICFEVQATTVRPCIHHNEEFLLELDPTRSLLYTFSQERIEPASPLTRCHNTYITNPQADLRPQILQHFEYMKWSDLS